MARSPINGYTSSVAVSCVAGGTAPSSACFAAPATMTPGSKTPFTVTAGGTAGDYNFNAQITGSDGKHVTHNSPVVLRVVNFGMSNPFPASVTVGRGATSAPVSFQITASGSFNQSVMVSCTTTIPNAICNLTPGPSVNPTSSAPVNMTASVTVPAGSTPGNYPVSLQATTTGAPSPLTSSFSLNVIANPDFILSEPSAFPVVNAGSTGTSGSISIAAQDGFTGTVILSCPTAFGAGSCSISPASVSMFPATAMLTINGTSFTAGAYSLMITATSGSTVHTLAVPFNVGDYSITGTQSISATAGAQVSGTFRLTSSYAYTGKINAGCDTSSLVGAMCSMNPANPITVSSGGTANLGVSINIPQSAIPGTYEVKINTQDTTGAPSHAATLTVTLTQDFRLTSSTPSQTVNAGQTTGAYNLRIQPVGSSFDGAVSLTCTAGLPAGAQCIFSPSTPIVPGTSAVDVVMSISTKASKAHLEWPRNWFYAIGLILPTLVVGWPASTRRMGGRLISITALAAVSLLLLFVPSCGGVSIGGGGGTTPPPITYHVTLTGSSPGTAPDAGQSTVVALVVD